MGYLFSMPPSQIFPSTHHYIHMSPVKDIQLLLILPYGLMGPGEGTWSKLGWWVFPLEVLGVGPRDLS